MWLFDRIKINYKMELREEVKEFMLKYIKEHPNSADDVVCVFSQADIVAQNLSKRELNKIIKRQGHSIEYLSLNIIQNCAMMELKPKSGIDYLQGNDYLRYLYDYVNELKFKRGYIGKQQFEENKMIGMQLSLVPPLGMW